MCDRFGLARAAVLGAALLVVSGCGESLDLSPVSGQITLDGKPLTNASVTFLPLEGSGEKVPATGTTDSQGRFVLWTGETAGAVPGRHAVSITNDPVLGANEELPDDRSLWKEPENPVPEKYGSLGKDSELTFNVPPGGTDQADFALEAK